MIAIRRGVSQMSSGISIAYCRPIRRPYVA